ncbi:MAG TPA: ATP-binding protein [Armatimonadota bacterium]
MLPRLSYRTKTFLATLAAAAGCAAVALAAASMGASWVVAAGLAFLFGVCGASIVSEWVSAPLMKLLDWAARPETTRLRLHSGDEWQDAAQQVLAGRREARRRLAEASTELAQLRAVLSTMADGVLVVDSDARVRLVNAAAAAILGVTEEQSLGRTVIECTVSGPLDDAVHKALGGEAQVAADLDLLYPQSRRVRALVSAAGHGRDRAAVAVLHDLTETFRLDQVRRDFVANVSHELRTPVSGIQTLAENLLQGALDDREAALGFLTHILQSTQRLVALVDDLLGLARAETAATVEQAPVPIGRVARAVMATMDPLISEKGLDVGVDVPDDLAALSDPESVRQIIGNLVDNAVKYTPPGGKVDVRAMRDGDWAVVCVADTGIGIPQEEQSRIFERFYRVDRHRSREAGGTGLGLSIVKHLVERVGGAVSVASTPGKGSAFTVRLPAA